MSLTAGTRFGPYQILAELGRGGMGEVYRARDTRLQRDVALKVLPAAFSTDDDRLARFRREAEVLASLNHPNITGIYGFEDAGETHALIMELVEGEDLAVQIARGPMPVGDALPIARQIVDALEAAHENGIVHRDLKPANVKVRADGTVKVLDFGLAKALAPEGSSATAEAMNSPTLTAAAFARGYGAPGTEMGVILGTAAYMAPEQAKGKPVDKRADIWAFGALLYEMLAGKRAFGASNGSKSPRAQSKPEGESVVEVLAAVLRQDLDLEALPVSTPAALRRLIARCLVRDPRQRLRDIGDARYDLDAAEREPDAAPSSAPPRASSRALIGALGVVAFASAAAVAWLLLSPPAPGVPVQLSIALPEGHNLESGPAISRDGRLVAWVSSDGVARPQLYVRALDQPEARLLPGTEEAAGPFFAPDGRWIAFYARNKLFKISVEGSAPVQLADSMSSAGGTWTDAGAIIFKRTWNGALHVVDDDGGKSDILIAPDKDEYAYTWPYAVPGRSEVFFASWGKEFNIIRLDTAASTKRVVSPGWRRIVVTPTGYLVGAGEAGELKAVFLGTAANERGPIVTVLENLDIGTAYGDARFDVSETGTLAYVAAPRITRRVVTVDRQGRSSPTSLPEDEYDELRLSASGSRGAVVSAERLAIVDLDRGTVTPLVPELGDRGARSAPVWSIDGHSITFASNHEGNWEIYSKSASGAGAIVPVLKMPLDQFPLGYAPDGTLLFQTTGPESGADLWLRDPGGSTWAWVATSAEESDGRFSPDGRFIAYSSNSSGRNEVYVQSRDNPADRLQVSATGGTTPAWSPLGNRVYFRRGTAMMEATISTTGGKLSASVPTQVFDGGWLLRSGYDVSPSGESFVMIQQPQEAIRKRIDIVLNWFARLEEKMRRR